MAAMSAMSAILDTSLSCGGFNPAEISFKVAAS